MNNLNFLIFQKYLKIKEKWKEICGMNTQNFKDMNVTI